MLFFITLRFSILNKSSGSIACKQALLYFGIDTNFFSKRWEPFKISHYTIAMYFFLLYPDAVGFLSCVSLAPVMPTGGSPVPTPALYGLHLLHPLTAAVPSLWLQTFLLPAPAVGSSSAESVKRLPAADHPHP